MEKREVRNARYISVKTLKLGEITWNTQKYMIV
jgi:hypothetical protein